MRGRTFIAIAAVAAFTLVAVIAYELTSSATAPPGAAPAATVTTTAGTSQAGHSPGPSPSDGAKPGALAPVSAAIGLRAGAVSPSAAGIAAAKAVLPKLSTLQLAGQRVIYSYSGPTPPASLLWLIRHGEAAGVIFFGDNVGTTPAQLANFKNVVAELKAANRDPANPVRLPLLLMTDQEGGLVRRLPGAPLLSEKQVGESSDPGTQATLAGRGAASNLRGFGLNVNLAPVLDVFRVPGNFIDQYGRSYSSDPHVAATLGTDFIRAQQAGGVAATVKHFPGLGAAATSQNTDLRPVTLGLTLSQIRTIDELPYQSAIPAGVKLVMVSWATYPALDPRYPAGLSRTVVHGELRMRLGFAGVTITDALEAGALKSFGTTASRATLAVKAGMDLLLCAAENPAQGDTAVHALRTYYNAGSPAVKAAFKSAAERVLALRATLPG